jgi:hypothetical protein
MKGRRGWCCFLALGLLINSPGPSLSAQVRFVPASYFGVRIGKATIADVTKRFGTATDTYQDNYGITWLYYRDIGPVPGKVEVQADSKSKVIRIITISPERLSLENAKKVFGSDFKVVRYAPDTCLDFGGDGPIYESANGPLEFIEYRSIGVVLERDAGRVIRIEYRSEAPGPKESQC